MRMNEIYRVGGSDDTMSAENHDDSWELVSGSTDSPDYCFAIYLIWIYRYYISQQITQTRRHTAENHDINGCSSLFLAPSPSILNPCAISMYISFLGNETLSIRRSSNGGKYRYQLRQSDWAECHFSIKFPSLSQESFDEDSDSDVELSTHLSDKSWAHDDVDKSEWFIEA